MKTHITDQTLVDILTVVAELPEEERDQVERLSGHAFDVDQFVVQCHSLPGQKWTIREIETGVPIVVGGIIPIGPTTYRTWFLAVDAAWSKYGKEVTKHTRRVQRDLLASAEHVRLETVCLARRYRAQRWYQAVGMEHESTMHGYGASGETAVMYVAVKGATYS